jgi:hypothetical protein
MRSSGSDQWPPLPSGTVISIYVPDPVEWQIVTITGVLVGVPVAVGGGGVSVAVGVKLGVLVEMVVAVLVTVDVAVDAPVLVKV